LGYFPKLQGNSAQVSQLTHPCWCGKEHSIPRMRPIWKGSISFGLVYIPVAVYPATREEKLSFRQLRSSDLSPIRYKKVAEADSKEVPADQIVKGFEFERGRYVVMKDEDFEKVRIESTHSIDITDFVDLEQVDPKFFYKPYFLEPQKGGEKAYAVLHKALSGTGKIGIAKVVTSNGEHIAAAKPATAPTPTNVVDLVKVLQDSLNRTQAVKQKRSSTRDGARRSTSTLVKQRRRAGALG